QLGYPGTGALQEQHVAREEDLVALDVGDPLVLTPDRHHPHAHLDGQLQVGQGPVRHLRAVTDPDAVGDLLGGGEVGDEGPGDAQAAGDDAADVDGGVAQPLDGAR